MTLLLRGEYGSRAYGTNTVDSDRDMVEVVVEPKEYITGLLNWDTKMDHTAEEGQRSTATDTDTTIYGLHKFAALALDGNPSILSVFFLPDYEESSAQGLELLSNRNLFVTKQAGIKFRGYMLSQRAAMTGARNKRTNRPELVHKYGYDTKFAYHMIRLGYLGIELMETGTIVLPMNDDLIGICMDIRSGKMTKEDVLAESEALELRLDKAIDNTTLSERGDKEAVSQLLHNIYMETWNK